jgi:hypothetical protein
MSFLTNDPTLKIRSVVDLLPAVTAASGAGSSRFVSTPDDNRDRRLTGVYATYQTKNFRLHIRVAGKELMVLDPQIFSATHGFLEVDQVYRANLQFEYSLESPTGSGAAIVANTDQIVFRYETTPDVSA